MNNTKKLAAAKKAYELDNAGQLWTTPRGCKPITQEAVLVIVDGLAYRLDTDAIKTHLAPKPKACPICKRKRGHKLDCHNNEAE